ncbi:hypothetical protein CF8_0191 [Aeromonas phage CF8]|nr:hypothetical protein CF8_0191 [Aeromonas phage CF8]
MNVTFIPLCLVIITVVVFAIWTYRSRLKTEQCKISDHFLIMILVSAVLGSGWMGALIVVFIKQMKFT